MNKTVIITGSTRGIGMGLAEEFLKKGYHVAISGRDQVRIDQAVSHLKGYHSESQILGIQADVRSEDSLENLWNQAFSRWKRIDIWINNAGIPQPQNFFYELSHEAIENLIATNITGMMLGSKVAIRGFLKQGFGAVYNMEGLGSNNLVIAKNILYGTSKAALTYFTRGLVRELKGTPVIAGFLSPGMVTTDFILKPAKEKGMTKDALFVFNTLADTVETVTPFLVKKMISNRLNGKRIIWLTQSKIIFRFLTSWFTRRKVIPD